MTAENKHRSFVFRTAMLENSTNKEENRKIVFEEKYTNNLNEYFLDRW